MVELFRNRKVLEGIRVQYSHALLKGNKEKRFSKQLRSHVIICNCLSAKERQHSKANALPQQQQELQCSLSNCAGPQ